MRLFALALMLSLTAVASAQTATPDSESGRYSFNPVADGVLRLDTRTGQVSQCSRGDPGTLRRIAGVTVTLSPTWNLCECIGHPMSASPQRARLDANSRPRCGVYVIVTYIDDESLIGAS